MRAAAPALVVALALLRPAVSSGAPAALRRYDVSGERLALTCSGAGAPTAVLDAGLGDDHGEWTAVQADASRFTRVCAWDRPGRGGSAPRPGGGATTADQVVADLHGLLTRAGVRPPYVLVGHSIGGADMRLYQVRHPRDVAGLVLVDATPESEILASPEPMTGGGESLDLTAGARAIAGSGWLGRLPLVVIERGQSSDDAWRSQQALLSERSTDAVLAVASGSDHAIPLREPALVAAAIRSAVTGVRTGARLPPCPSPISAAGGDCLRPGTLPSTGTLSITRGQLALGLGLAALLGLGLGVLANALWRRRRTGRSAAGGP
jgi:predicted alpha/beta hydrolase family esterase